MKRWFPTPVLSIVLALLWLMLNQSLSVGQGLLAALVGWAVPLLTLGLRPQPVRLRRPAVMLRLLGRVLVDAVASNLQVIAQLLTPRSRAAAAGFVHVPLQLRDPNALAVLALVVCNTPGTAWAELSRDRTVLLLHALDASDPEGLVRLVQTRYEQPLMEIFQ